MIKAERIPDEVVEAAHRAFYAEKPCGFRDALAAGLAAWPGMHIGAPWVIGVPNSPSVILPLTQEPST